MRQPELARNAVTLATVLTLATAPGLANVRTPANAHGPRHVLVGARLPNPGTNRHCSPEHLPTDAANYGPAGLSEWRPVMHST